MATSLWLELDVPKTPLLTGKAAEVVAKHQVRAMTWGVQKAKAEIVPQVPVNTGLTRRAVQTAVYGDRQDLVGRVFNPMGHALPLEGGAKWDGPWPPVGPLLLGLVKSAWKRRCTSTSGAMAPAR